MPDPAAVTAFIRVRLGELEAAAKNATDGPWYQVGMRVFGYSRPYAGGEPGILVIRHTWPQEAAHILLNDPPSTLRAVTAIRAVLAAYECIGVCREETQEQAEIWREYATEIIPPILAIWDTHPDYPGTAP